MNWTAVKALRASLFSTLIFVSVFTFAQQKGGGSEAVVATIGNQKITLDEFNKKYNEAMSQPIKPPSKQVFLEDLVRYHVGLQEAEKRGLEKDPIVIERLHEEMYKALLEKELGPKVQKIEVSEAEMKNWYKKNPEIRSSHILIEFKPGSTPAQITEAKKRATEIYDEVKKSKRPFEELVKLYSDDPLSKQAGGDVGWQSRLTLAPTYYDAIANMKVGEVKGLIETPFGFHIIKVTGRRSYDDANKRELRTAVFDEKRKQIFNEYFEKLKKQYPIKVNNSALK